MDRLVRVGDRLDLDSVTLYDPDGTPVQLVDLLDRAAVIPLVRYYGCMPCKAFLHDLNDVRDDLERDGLRVLAVGGAADYQARDLTERGIAFPLLLDPGHTLYETVDVRHIHWGRLLSPTTW